MPKGWGSNSITNKKLSALGYSVQRAHLFLIIVVFPKKKKRQQILWNDLATELSYNGTSS